MNAEALLKEEIERELSFFEEQAATIGPPYLLEVEKLAKKVRDPVMADFIRNTMKPECIRSEIERARFCLQLGRIEDAHSDVRRLRTNIEFVASRIKYRYLLAGYASSSGASDGGKRDRGLAARDCAMAERFQHLHDAEQKKLKVLRRTDRQLVKLVGRENYLKLSASYEAIERGKKLSG